MNKEEVLSGLENFKISLLNEVLQAYQTRGSHYGNERFRAWRNKFTKFLDLCLPNESSRLNTKLHHMIFMVGGDESEAQRFWREDGEVCESFIDSLIIDLQSDECDFGQQQLSMLENINQP